MLEEELLKHGYQIEAEIGKGASATTYRALSFKTNQAVAVKVISLREVKDWKIIELFEREAKVLASLEHPHIPKYIDYLTIDSPTDRYFVMVQQLAIGQSLQDLCEQGWQPDELQIKHIAIQLMEILAYLHQLNPPVIHRDIKPANVIYQPDEQKVFLVDFGAVQDVYRNTFSYGKTFVGTMGFVAPEQYKGSVSFASDLYSLGATLVYLITGMNPADIPRKRLKIDWRPVASINISEDFSDWVDNLLEPIPEDRASSTADALTLLKDGKKDSFGLKPNISSPAWVNLEWNTKRSRDRLEIVATLKDFSMKDLLLWVFDIRNTFLAVGLRGSGFPELVVLSIAISIASATSHFFFVPFFLSIFLSICCFFGIVYWIFASRLYPILKLQRLKGKTYFEVRIDQEELRLFQKGTNQKYVLKTDQVSEITSVRYPYGIDFPTILRIIFPTILPKSYILIIFLIIFCNFLLLKINFISYILVYFPLSLFIISRFWLLLGLVWLLSGLFFQFIIIVVGWFMNNMNKTMNTPSLMTIYYGVNRYSILSDFVLQPDHLQWVGEMIREFLGLEKESEQKS
jgi:serine/threonine protein kinase